MKFGCALRDCIYDDGDGGIGGHVSATRLRATLYIYIYDQDL